MHWSCRTIQSWIRKGSYDWIKPMEVRPRNFGPRIYYHCYWLCCRTSLLIITSLPFYIRYYKNTCDCWQMGKKQSDNTQYGGEYTINLLINSQLFLFIG